jgi:hypothetical protein
LLDVGHFAKYWLKHNKDNMIWSPLTPLFIEQKYIFEVGSSVKVDPMITIEGMTQTRNQK